MKPKYKIDRVAIDAVKRVIGGRVNFQNLPRQAILCETTNETFKPDTDSILAMYGLSPELIDTKDPINSITYGPSPLFPVLYAIEVINWFFEQKTRRHLIVANRLKQILINP